VSRRDGNGEIYLMNVDGTGVENLTKSPSNDVGPALSPYGSKIAFMSDRDGNSEVYVMNADGTGQVRLTNSARPRIGAGRRI
jgi:TolB protein